MSAFTNKACEQAGAATAENSANMNAPEAMRYVALYGAALGAITEQECVRVIMQELDAGRGGWLMTLNLDHLRRFVREPAFAALVNKADLRVADGMPLIWASHLQNTPLPERITGADLIWSLSRNAAAQGRSIFLLGGSPTTAARSAEILQQRYPRLRIAGVYAPLPGFERQAGETQKIFEMVRRAQPDIIYVGLGSPKQDALILHLCEVAPHAWCIGVGISFSWVAGVLPRAPLWMQRSGLEWLHRLWQEPFRLGRRYLVHNMPFAIRLFGHALLTRAQDTRVRHI